MSKKTLVIVESPGKIAKIGQILGPNYIVKASFGHVQDLDKNTLSIEVENNFNPLYKVTPDKIKVVKELKALAKDSHDILLAADGDREGEAIAFSLASVLNIKTPKRIIFNEITKTALLKAVENPITINYNMVNAQQARRLLDRLVGYKISPVLGKYLASKSGLSAGRVQSVVVRIIVDKEKEITDSISTPYFKTTAEFNFGETKLIGLLKHTFEDENKGMEFLNNINKKTEFKVASVKNMLSIRKPSAPFITSSLQQEASTKLHFSVKRTMDVAQKLYEAGHITYMRSDSMNISKEAISEASKYIEETWGKEYSDPKNYETKNASSQGAHECIRPTHMNHKDIEQLEGDMKKLYSLIWKRTIASQMANARVNVQTIMIDMLNMKLSCLIFNSIQTYFISTLENMEFPGYMIVYDNTNEDSDTQPIGKLEIKVKDKLTLHKMKISEEYTKPPLRYNEAALVKYLEKNGIGRPSTYASIISKVIEREYVEIKNVEGVAKDSRQMEMNNKFKINVSTKEVVIGTEQKKLVPTSNGITVNDFMMKYFDPIMDIEFTANFETYLDKIADGKANWVTILRTFYDMFNPIVEKLTDQAKNTNKDILLGNNINNVNIYKGVGKYGPYVKMEENGKFKYAPITNENITLEEAIILLEFPKKIGKIGNSIVTLNRGQYGLYLKCNDMNYSIKDSKVNIKEIDITYAKEIINGEAKNVATNDTLLGPDNMNNMIYVGKGSYGPYVKKMVDDKWKYISIKEDITLENAIILFNNINNNNSIKTFNIKNKTINIRNGEFGNYIQIISGKKKQNISIPKKINTETITIEEVLKIIAMKNGTK